MIRLYGSSFATIYSRFKSAYNKCIKKMFGYTRRDSMTGVNEYKIEYTTKTLRNVYSRRLNSSLYQLKL